MNLQTTINLKNAGALWNFYSSPVNVFLLLISGYGVKRPNVNVKSTWDTMSNHFALSNHYSYSKKGFILSGDLILHCNVNCDWFGRKSYHYLNTLWLTWFLFYYILEAPSMVTISRQPQGTLKEGDYVNLTCSTTDSNPAPTLKWTRGQYRDIDDDPRLFHQVQMRFPYFFPLNLLLEINANSDRRLVL